LKPKVLGFHMSDTATCFYMLNKETVTLEGRERKLMTQHGKLWEEAK
jgi:hypothetical protein